MLEAGFFDPQYRHVIYQPHFPQTSTVWQAAAFTEVHTAIVAGFIELAEVGAVGIPYNDDGRDENNLLLDSLPDPFEATFTGGPRYIGDGSFGWREEIGLEEQAYKPRSSVILEVGHVSATTTLWHLMTGNWLARWPYGDDRVYLLHVLDRDGLWEGRHQ